MARMRPSPAMIVAAITLTFAMAGTSIAADPVAKLNKKKVAKIANKQIDKRAPGLSVKSAQTANAATIAGDANNLGGQAAANYLRTNACQPGSVLGFAKIDGAAVTPQFSTTGVSLARNCSGGTVEARQFGFAGQYEVRFNGVNSSVATVAANDMGDCQAAEVDSTATPGTFELRSIVGCGAATLGHGVLTVVAY